MPIQAEEMQEIVKHYENPTIWSIGTHSTLDKLNGLRNYNLRRVVYVPHGRANIYLQVPMVADREVANSEKFMDLPAIVRRDQLFVSDPHDLVRKKHKRWKQAVLLVENYTDLYKKEYMDAVSEMEGMHTVDRGFSTYMAKGDPLCRPIENDFPIPILGKRILLKIENRGGIPRDYYWFAEQARIPTPKSFAGMYKITKRGIRFKEFIDEPMLLKAENAQRELERHFVWASDSKDMEEQIELDVKRGFLSKEVLEYSRLEQIVIGPHANFNFFYSPIWAKENWGSTEKAFASLYKTSIDVARKCLANQFISIDERRETIWDGIRRLPVDIQQKLRNKEKEGSRAPPTFEVTLHSLISVRESLIKDMLWCANNLLLEFLKEEPNGCLPWCLQTLVTWDKVSKFGYKPGLKAEYTIGDEPKTGEDYGIYDAGKAKDLEMHLFVTQDVAVRHGGGANVHMGIGGQYSNAVLGRTTSLGDRYAMEIKNALRKKKLPEIVT